MPRRARHRHPRDCRGRAENTLIARALADPPGDGPDRFYPLLFLWADRLGETPPPRATAYIGRGDNPVAIFRSSWDHDATFVGIKGGSPSVNHGHMDVGSFVLDMKGIRFAEDLGMQDYNSLEQRGLKLWDRTQGSDRWTIFRIGAFSHNILTVNEQPQLVEARADFAKTTDDAAILDLSVLYAGQLTSARRGIRLNPDGSVRLQDELASDTPATVRWAMVTRADVRILGNTATLTRDGQTIVVRVGSPEDVTLDGVLHRTASRLRRPQPGHADPRIRAPAPARRSANARHRFPPGQSAGCRHAPLAVVSGERSPRPRPSVISRPPRWRRTRRSSTPTTSIAC